MPLKLPSGISLLSADSARGRMMCEQAQSGKSPSLLIAYNKGADMLNVLSFIAAAVLFVAMTVFLAEAWPTPPSLENGLFTLFLLVAVVYYFAGFWRDKRWYALFDDRLCSSAGAFAKDDVEDIVVSKAMYSFRHTQFGVCLITRDGTRYILASRDLSLARMKWLADAMRAWLGKAPWKPSPGDE